MKNVTIFLFESAWTNKFTEEDNFLPQASILPYVKALSENSGCNVIYRQIRTEQDFKTWSSAIKDSNTGIRIIWIAGHGIRDKNTTKIYMPDYIKTNQGNLLEPKTIKSWLNKAGKIDGIIIDSCEFGLNDPESWIPDKTKWAMAYSASVNWTESVFFGIKTLEWIYERSEHPANGEKAKSIFTKCITTGGFKNKNEQFSLKDFATALKVNFYFKIKGSKSWQVAHSDNI